MWVYQQVSVFGLGFNMLLLVLVGLLVNGPYALITTAVSAELGTHRSLEGNSKALATVTAIIDGTGSIGKFKVIYEHSYNYCLLLLFFRIFLLDCFSGAAVGPLMAGFVTNYGWQKVFVMLMISDILALFLLLRLVKQEFLKYRNARRAGIRIE